MTIHFLIVSEVQEFRSSLAGWFWLSISHEAVVKIWARSRPEGPASKMAHLHDSWQEASGPHPVKLLECPHNMAASCLQSK